MWYMMSFFFVIVFKSEIYFISLVYLTCKSFFVLFFVFCCEFAAIQMALDCTNQIIFSFLPSFPTLYDWCFSFSHDNCISVDPKLRRVTTPFFDDFYWSLIQGAYHWIFFVCMCFSKGYKEDKTGEGNKTKV